MNPIYNRTKETILTELSAFEKETLIHLLEVAQELERSSRKHPKWPTDVIHCVAIMGEEAGETVQAAIDYAYKNKSIEGVNDEAIQTAAMCIRLLNSFGNLSPEAEKVTRQNTKRPQA